MTGSFPLNFAPKPVAKPVATFCALLNRGPDLLGPNSVTMTNTHSVRSPRIRHLANSAPLSLD